MILLLLLLLTTNVFADITFAEEEQIKLALSNKDINKIAVKGDKIQSINGPTGAYTAKNDPLGAMYLSTTSDKSFTVFLTTAAGHNVSLLITPKAITGKTTTLQPTLRLDTYQKEITDLITAMINQEELSNYSYQVATKAKSSNFYKLATIKPQSYYIGSKFVGIISSITNKTSTELKLLPSYFYQVGVKAVTLSQTELAAKTSCLLYQIIEREKYAI